MRNKMQLIVVSKKKKKSRTFIQKKLQIISLHAHKHVSKSYPYHTH